MSLSIFERSAFPCDNIHENSEDGLTKREYACIQLRVPRSANDELDVLIKEAHRHDAAAKAMSAMLIGIFANKPLLDKVGDFIDSEGIKIRDYVKIKAYDMADAMLEEPEQKESE